MDWSRSTTRLRRSRISRLAGDGSASPSSRSVAATMRAASSGRPRPVPHLPEGRSPPASRRSAGETASSRLARACRSASSRSPAASASSLSEVSACACPLTSPSAFPPRLLARMSYVRGRRRPPRGRRRRGRRASSRSGGRVRRRARSPPRAGRALGGLSPGLVEPREPPQGEGEAVVVSDGSQGRNALAETLSSELEISHPGGDDPARRERTGSEHLLRSGSRWRARDRPTAPLRSHARRESRRPRAPRSAGGRSLQRVDRPPRTSAARRFCSSTMMRASHTAWSGPRSRRRDSSARAR